jgi:protein SCO1
MTRTIALVTALLASLLTLPAAAHSLKDVEDMLNAREFYLQVVDAPAPDFSLLDADGRPVKLADFRGKVVVLYFIYASCPDVCPLQSEKLAQIQEDINETPMRDLVQFVAVTTDPVRDTANVLKEYGPAHGLDPANWIFLTSGPDHPTATRELAWRYGLKFTEEAGGEQMHGVVTHLIDKSGNLRARYHGLKFNATNFIVHVNALTNDTH